MAPSAGGGAASQSDPSPTPSGAIQLLVRNIDSRTIVVRAQLEDTLDSVLERLGKAVAHRGDVRVEYAGRYLQGEATIGELGLPPDATLHVTARLLSTPHPHAWNVTAQVSATAAKLAAAGWPEFATCLDRLVSNFLNSAQVSRKRKTCSPWGPVADHMAIFLRSGAPGALAQIYLSSNIACRVGVERAIRRFVVPDLVKEHNEIKAWTAPVLVEFSRTIAAVPARQADALYSDLRSTLAVVLCDPEWSPACWLDVSPEPLAEQLTRFAVEKANTVMESIAKTHLMHAAAKKNMAEFKIFSSALRRQVRRLGANTPRCPWWTALSMMLMSLPRCVDEYMAMVDNVLHRREQFASSSAPLNWCGPLPCVWVVLSELDSWSAMDWWPEIRCKLRASLAAHTAATRALLLCAGKQWCQNIIWITRHRDLLDFEARRNLAMTALPKVPADSDTPYEMLIDRSKLLADSFEYIAYETPKKLRAGLWVEFMHEQAIGPGALREWFCMVFQALFNPRQVLFSACPSDRRRFFVNPASTVDPLHRQYYEFAGRMVALALMHNIQVGVLFDRTLFLQLADRPVTLDDIVDADPSLHASCKKILEMDTNLLDSNALGLTFVREVDLLGSRTVTELISGGKDVAVDSKNRHEYIRLLIQDSFVNCTRTQVAYLTLGFSNMFGQNELSKIFLEALDVEDFNQILGGSRDAIDVKEWKAHTDCHGYSRRSSQVKWFWKAVEAMTVEQRRRLLFFWTSVEYLPFNGFSGLSSRLCIFRSHNSCDHLPTSATCFYQLSLPSYTSIDMMQSRLQMIVQEHISSSFGKS